MKFCVAQTFRFERHLDVVLDFHIFIIEIEVKQTLATPETLWNTQEPCTAPDGPKTLNQ